MNYKAAKKHLLKDKKLKPIITEIGLPDLEPTGDIFYSLTRSIIAQQISSAAAKSVQKRFEELLDFDLSPTRILDTEIDDLRSAGLSRSKAQYVHNVAEAFQVNKWTDEQLNQLSNEELTTELVSIKGVGEWTAQMILIFSLGRADIWPIGDLVVRQNYQRVFELDLDLHMRDIKAHMSTFAAKWSPYRSYAALLMWHIKHCNYKL